MSTASTTTSPRVQPFDASAAGPLGVIRRHPVAALLALTFGLGVVASAQSTRLVADGWQGEAVQSGRDTRHTVSLPGEPHPLALGGNDHEINDLALWHERVESRMRCKAHVRFGGRGGETGWLKGQHRASFRSYPRVVPIWFHWTGQVVSMGTPAAAPKVKALRRDPRVAITVDGGAFPYTALLIRGQAQVEVEADITADYRAAARRYPGEEAGLAGLDQARALTAPMAHVAVRPDWVAILDFQNRFPSALARRMRAAAGA